MRKPTEQQIARWIKRDREHGLDDPAYQLIIRATWERGERQEIALGHMAERGLWLSDDQKRQAGL
jgi:hypothetical protein